MPTTLALVATSVNQVELREVVVADPGESQVLVRSEFSVASPGTELRCLAGRQADIAFPFVLGYSAAGVVEKAGRGSGLAEGDRVFCPGGLGFQDGMNNGWGGHSLRILQEAAKVVPMPPRLSARRAAAAKIAAIAHHGRCVARPATDDRVVVLGLGLLGQISARWFASGHEVLACDLDETRIELADEAGLQTMRIDRDLQPLAEQWANRADIVVDVTGVDAVIDQAVRLLRSRPWGDTEQRPPIYLVQGSYPGAVSIDYQPAFVKEAAFLFPRDNGRADNEAALQALADETLQIDDLLGYVVSPAQAQEAYDELRGRSRTLTAVFDWGRVSG